MARIEPITGRYIWVPFQGEEYRIYFEEAGEPLDKSSSPELSFIITASGLFVAFFFVYPTPVLSAAAAAAASLFAG